MPGPFWGDQIETSQDVYDWSHADRVVQEVQSKQQALLATLWPFAQWDQQRCHASEPQVADPFQNEKQVWLMSVCHVDSYQEWVSNVVERYDGDGSDDMPGLLYPITHWEIASEPDADPAQAVYYQYGPDAYSESYRLAYDSIRAAQPGATVVFAGLSGVNPRSKEYWKQVLESERARSMLHTVHAHAASDQFFSKEFHELLDSVGLPQSSFWVTDAQVGSFVEWDEDKKAQMMFVGSVQAFANGAEKVFHNLKGQPEAVQTAFDTAVQTLDGFQSVEWVGRDQSVIKFSFEDKTVFALWDGDALPEDVSGTVEVVSYHGKKSRVDAKLVMSSSPVFVIIRL